MPQKIDPVAELRSEIELAVDEASACGVRHYQLAEVLEQAAQAVRVRHAATAPLP